MAKKAIENEFKKSVWNQGFSLEQNVFRILEKDGWLILPNRNFFDRVGGLTKEFDLLAFKVKKQFNTILFTILIIECKFNPDKIVFYVRPTERQVCLPQFYAGDFTKKFIKGSDVKDFFTNIKKYKYIFEDSEQVFGYQVFEKIEKSEKNRSSNKIEKKLYFKARQDFSEKRIFGAINTVMQATIYEKKTRNKTINTNKFFMYFPTVIFSDELYKACLTSRKTLKRQDIFHYKSGMTFGGDESLNQFDIHISTISKLNSFLQAINYVHKQFSLLFFKKIKGGK